MATTSECLPRRQRGRFINTAEIAKTLREIWLTVERWQERAKERRALLALDDRLLRDIGLSRADALREGSKPFWRP
ncbi:MAG: hypothetical protein Kow006_27670 [Gammaproteobacteria bacterium]